MSAQARALVRVRRMTAGDAGLAADVCLRTTLLAYAAIFPLEAPPPTYGLLEADWAERLESGAACFVAETVAAGDAVGVVAASERLDEPGVGLLARLYVLPERWGNGVGRALYDAALEEFARRGFATASLWVLRPNLRARSFYERDGWQATGVVKPVYPPAGLEDIEYRRSLRSE